jgi:uncharacterized Zn finger protein
MERLEFLVQGSASDPYRVTLERLDNNLNAYCTCSAGSNGQTCKHRMRILSGNPDGLIEANIEHLKQAVDWLVGTDVELALSELARAEDAFETAKQLLAAAKKKVAKSLMR